MHSPKVPSSVRTQVRFDSAGAGAGVVILAVRPVVANALGKVIFRSALEGYMEVIRQALTISLALLPSFDAVRAFLGCADRWIVAYAFACACKNSLSRKAVLRIVSRCVRAFTFSKFPISVILHLGAPPTVPSTCTALALGGTVVWSDDAEVLALAKLSLPTYPGDKEDKESGGDFDVHCRFCCKWG